MHRAIIMIHDEGAIMVVIVAMEKMLLCPAM
jgi:hypothetical protein